MNFSSSEKKNVCIIGGGPAGLVSLRRVLESPFLTGTVFEQKDDIGGVWYYKRGEKKFNVSEKNLVRSGYSDNDQNPECTTTMYDDLTCNLPFPLMEFRDFPIQVPNMTFLSQQEMHEYLQKYTNHFNLWPHIQLNTSIISVRAEEPITPTNVGKPGRWIVETHNHKNNTFATTIFDAVMVCVGKNSYPYQPPVFPGLDTFQGQVLHCKYFKNPDSFRNKSVVLIGLGPSSADLALHLSTAAASVTVCHRFVGGFGLGLLPKNVKETNNVKLITETGVVTEEDEHVSCDTIIFCTGYSINFPFFNEETCGIQVIEGKYVPNLYKMTVFTKRPTLAILNLCYRSPEIILVEAQAKYFVMSLEQGKQHPGKKDSFKLPSYSEMELSLKAEEDEKRAKNWPYSHWHQVGDFGTGTWKYFLGLCEEAGFKEEHCEKWPLLESLIVFVFLKRIFGKLALYKKDEFRYVSENVWEYRCSADTNLFPDVKPERVTMTLDNETGLVKTDTIEICERENAELNR